MGKGQRSRAAREQHAERGGGKTYPFDVDERTREQLGEGGLDELAATLWLKDCQTCGWELGTPRPSLVCTDMMVMCRATLHHSRCQTPQWIDSGPIISPTAELLSYDTQTFLMPGQVYGADGTPSHIETRPVFYVNPGLEMALLKRTDQGWRNEAAHGYEHFGLYRPTPGHAFDQVAEGVTARINGDDIEITMPFAHWTCGMNVPFREAVEDSGGILLALTSAARPSDMSNADDFIKPLHAGRVSLGWVRLDNTPSWTQDGTRTKGQAQ